MTESRKIRFHNQDGVELVGQLELPESTPRAVALFAHCFTCSKDLRSARLLSGCLVDEGMAVLRFDFTGLGESDGEFEDTTFTSNVRDLVAAADWLRTEGPGAPEILVGHSLGGAAVLMAATEIPESRAVCTIAAPSEPSHLGESVLSELDPEAEVSDVLLAGRPFRIRRELFEDVRGVRLLDRLADLRRALLIMHSPVDDTVSVEHARKLYEAAKHPKSFVSLDGADHLLLEDPDDARFAARMLAAWVSRYLPEPSADAEIPHERPKEGEVTVRGPASGYTQHITTQRHQLVADEPKRLGGADLGPNPYEFLLASLGSCISMTLRMVADRKEIPLTGVEVTLRHDRVHAKDCEDCETKEGRVDRITKRLRLTGDLTEEQRDYLVEISQRCPVHRTLVSETKIDLEE